MSKETLSRALHYAVRLPVLGRYLGQLMIVLAVLTLPPLAVALATGSSATAARYLLVYLPVFAAGVLLARLPAPASLQANEALVVTALAFLFAALAATYPLMSAELGFSDALFESVSAITTTGLSVAGSVEDKPAAFLFARAWMQWCGGLGIVVLTVALVFGYGAAARQVTDSPVTHENIETSTRLLARRVLLAYLAVSAAGIALLSLAGLPPFEAVTHALAAVSTGGFSTHDTSAAALGGWLPRLTLALLAFAGAIALPLYHRLWRRNWRQFAADPELRALAVACVLVTGLLALLLSRQHSGLSAELVGHALFMATSAQTTTGFATLPVGEFDATGKALLVISMAIGGGMGSTAGGIKLWRLLLLLRLAQLIFRRIGMPKHAVAELRMGGNVVESDELTRALFFILLFFAIVLLSWLPFLWFGYDPLDALFEVVSALGTVGLSTGIASPDLHPLLKGILSMNMLLGRLEIVAVLVLFALPTWFGRRMTS